MSYYVANKRNTIYRSRNYDIQNIDLHTHNNTMQGLIYLVLFLTSIIIATIVAFLTIFNKQGYEMLFMLPLSFIFMLFISSKQNYSSIPYNLGFTLILGLEFIRLVLTPALYVLSGCPETITYNAVSNTPYGILLLVYEALWLSFAISRKPRVKSKDIMVTNLDDRSAFRRMNRIVFFVLVATVIVCAFAPEILQNYRTILNISESDFSATEQSYIVSMYSTSTIKKFFLVLVNYILKPSKLIIPAFLIVLVHKFSKKYNKFLCFILALSPFWFIDGTLARSLYFTLVLLLFYNSFYRISTKKIGIVLAAAAMFIIVYWTIRYYVSNSSYTLLAYFAEKLNDYFAGFNIAAATFNLPKGIEPRIKYFFHDFLRTIPFSNTLFGLDSSDTVRTFFNYYTHAPGGQVATTIGMGSYYFTPIFAPAYSYFFARVAINNGMKAQLVSNPYYKLIYYIMAVYFALGIGMNDISVTLSNYVQVILPIIIIVRIAYPRIRGKVENDT